MNKKEKLSERQIMAFLATENPSRDLIAAGWTPGDLIAAGWTSRDLRAAGWTPRDLRAAGWTSRDLRAAGWTPRDLRAAGWTPGGLIAAGWTSRDLIAAGWTSRDLIAAGWTPGDLRAAGWTPRDLRAAGWTPRDIRVAGCTEKNMQDIENEWNSIPTIEKLYSKLLGDIKEKKRLHDQSEFGPNKDPGQILCKTPMCTAGHLVNMAGEVGYELMKKYGWKSAARLIHMKSRPDAPPQNYGNIPEKFAMAYIEERAAEEA